MDPSLCIAMERVVFRDRKNEKKKRNQIAKKCAVELVLYFILKKKSILIQGQVKKGKINLTLTFFDLTLKQFLKKYVQWYDNRDFRVLRQKWTIKCVT